MISSIRKFVFRYLLLILIGYIASRSPLFMSSTPRSPGPSEWADGPVALIATPQVQTKNVWKRPLPHPIGLLLTSVYHNFAG